MTTTTPTPATATATAITIKKEMFATKIEKTQNMCSDLERMSSFFFSSAFTSCFLYDANGNITSLNANDTFVKGRPDTLIQLFIIQLIREIDYECRNATITNSETNMRLLNILQNTIHLDTN